MNSTSVSLKIRLFALLLLVPVTATADDLRISVAASLADVVTARCATFAALAPGTRCLVNRGGSGALARQIEQGAPTDLFIAASAEWLDYLRRLRLLDETSIIPLLGNRLVFVGPPGGVRSLPDVASLKHIALGNPATVPAGAYAEAALRARGLWTGLHDGGALVYTQDVRQALAYAERGEVDGAFVYRSDALQAKHVVVLFEVPAELHAPLVAPLALTAAGAANEQARAFWRYLQSPESASAFAAAGFTRP